MVTSLCEVGKSILRKIQCLAVSPPAGTRMPFRSHGGCETPISGLERTRKRASTQRSYRVAPHVALELVSCVAQSFALLLVPLSRPSKWPAWLQFEAAGLARSDQFWSTDVAGPVWSKEGGSGWSTRSSSLSKVRAVRTRLMHGCVGGVRLNRSS